MLTLLGGSRWSAPPSNAEEIIMGAAALLGLGAGVEGAPCLNTSGEEGYAQDVIRRRG
jgi:hypothetical protein